MGSEVAKSTLASVTEIGTDTVMAIIARAATDPNCDIDKMERLLQMKERMDAKAAEAAFNGALNQAQSEIGTIGTNKSNSQTHSMYANYEKMDVKIRPVYLRNGFSLSFDNADGAPDGCIRVVCYVSHSAGHTRRYQTDMPTDGKGAKGNDVMTKTHAAGSAMSYGMRYLLKMIFNVAVGEHDDDGNAAAGVEYINDKQIVQINEMIESYEVDKDKFLKWAKVESVGEITVKQYPQILMALKAKEKAK